MSGCISMNLSVKNIFARVRIKEYDLVFSTLSYVLEGVCVCE